MVKYDTYVDSQTPYVGEIPSHWKMVQNKRVMHKEKRICESYNGQNIISLTLNGAIVRDLGAGGKMPATFDGYQHVYPGELLMCLFDIDVTPRCVGRVNNEGLTSPAYSSFVLHDNANLGYYYYYYLMLDHTKELLHLAKNLRHSLTEEQIGQIKVPLPPIPEQEAIADYLDRETDRIDSIIAEAKDSMEEYKAWKASIIYEAVTKGLDPNVEMKDSGVEWIGKIPVGWNVQKLKTLVEEPLQYGANEAGIEYDESLPRYIRITDVTANGELKEEGKLSLSEDIAADYILNDGDILLARSGGTVGKAFYYKAEYGRAAFAGYMIRAKINRKKIDPKLVYFSTLSANYDDWKATSMTQATIQNIGANKYNEFYIVVPPIEKQAELVSYLEEKVVQIDNLIVEKESLINDLESYKKSLIFEVVTGKRKVV